MSSFSDFLFSWLAIHKAIYRYPHISKKILSTFATIQNLFSDDWQDFVLPSDSSDADAASYKLLREAADHHAAELTLKVCEKLQVSIVSIEDETYPELLRETAYPPPILFIQGNQDVFNVAPCIGVVGSRRISPYGRQMAERLSAGLSEYGLTVVSGLAYGVDSAAHWAVVGRCGVTAAVLGSGFKHFYPAVHRKLADRIIQASGAVVSEFPLDEAPERVNFPMRNRIISGVSLGVLVVEAAEKSGSLITATWAADQGRDVFAVPNAVGRDNSGGVHRLISEGAKLVESVDDIVEVLLPKLPASIVAKKKKSRHSMTKNANERAVLEMLKVDSATIDEIVEETKLALPDVAALLLNLECNRHIRRVDGGRYILLK